ncbi:RNA polymerase sigma factor [Tautonia plasticadhaerens]|uniref:ECF RNA polymerase sigma factor SigE n=1 Tax=Tautonia plasticadhaerens TaxID=2527974 RepID=A0A518HCH6_9BACT|nr:RNA polymerase sigma factor [Tautonia plasticadhaerens]QDV38356.1 ECF RNA polymerase sigma factor SigE [Tautonia plasticadhaerens]
MPTRRTPSTASNALRTLFNLGVIGNLTDGQLLERFATRDGEAAELAFAAIVERHGPMVLRACRSVLADPHDAQDAFQATFLVLARRAEALWVRDSIGPWLFSVALRVSRHSRAADARRRRHERRSAEHFSRSVVDDPSVEPDPSESPLLAELDRLPARFRDPVVLCDLQGRSYDQAARHLGLPVGTLKSRLARGRSRLRDRLRRLGLSPGFAATGVRLPSALIDSTSSAAMRAASGVATAGTVPASVILLASGALWMMRLASFARWTAAALAVSLTGVGLAAAAALFPSQEPPPPAPASASAPKAAPAVAPPEADPGPVISFDVRFIEVPGLMARSMGIDFDFGSEPPMGLSFLSDLEARLFADALTAIPDVTIVQAPRVTTYPGAAATVAHSRAGEGTDLPLPGRSVPEPLELGIPRAEPDPVKAAEPIPEGIVATLTGRPSDDGRSLTIDLDIRDVHVVERHELVFYANNGKYIGDFPEVVRTRFDQRVTIPDRADSALLVSLGLRRTATMGRSSISDHYVLIRARTIPLDPPLAIPADSPKPRPAPAGMTRPLGSPHDTIEPLPAPTESLKPLPAPSDSLKRLPIWGGMTRPSGSPVDTLIPLPAPVDAKDGPPLSWSLDPRSRRGLPSGPGIGQ